MHSSGSGREARGANGSGVGAAGVGADGVDGATRESQRYPLGRFEREEQPTAARRAEWIETLASLPSRLRSAVSGLDDARLDTPYRPGGWTVRQVVHHLADSHVNAYVRFGLALAEEGRTVSVYEEAAWAEQPYARTAPLDASLALLDGLHARWSGALRMLDAAAFRRTIDHPDHGLMTVDDLLGLYAWHSRHHVAHILGLRSREGWGEPGA